MQTVDTATDPVSDVPAALRLAESRMKKSKALAAHFGQLAKAWQAHGFPDEAERFLRGFEAGLTDECVMLGRLSPRPVTLRQRIEHRRHFGGVFDYEVFVEVALVWDELGRPDDAKRCMKKAEAAAVSMGRGGSVVWDVAAPCLRGWLAMGRPGDGAAFLDDLQRKFGSEMYVEDWVGLAKMRCMFPGAMPAAAQCLGTAEGRTKSSAEWLAVAGGWLACLRVEDAARCAREAEKKGGERESGGWREIAKFWLGMGCKEDARRCAAKAEEVEWGTA